MYVGQFPFDECVAVERTDRVTDLIVYRRFLVSKSAPDEKVSEIPVPDNTDPFPKVDDIVDRLSNRINDTHERAQARS